MVGIQQQIWLQRKCQTDTGTITPLVKTNCCCQILGSNTTLAHTTGTADQKIALTSYYLGAALMGMSFDPSKYIENVSFRI